LELLYTQTASPHLDLQASQETTWAMAACVTAGPAVNNTRSRSDSMSLIGRFIGIMRFDLDDVTFDRLRLRITSQPLDVAARRRSEIANLQ
jgi:hypothetical protein